LRYPLIALLIGANIQSDGGRTFVGFLWFAGTLAFGIRYGIAASAASDAKQEILSKSRAIREAALNGFFAEHPEVASASD